MLLGVFGQLAPLRRHVEVILRNLGVASVPPEAFTLYRLGSTVFGPRLHCALTGENAGAPRDIID